MLHHDFDAAITLDDLSVNQDAFDWHLSSRPQYLFSVSTYAGTLPRDQYDLQVSIVGESLDNGDIVFGPEAPLLDGKQICDLVSKFIAGSLL